MANRWALIALSALAGLPATTVWAQNAQAVAPGTRVRVTAEETLIGKLVTMNAERLVLEIGRDQRTVPRPKQQRFEVSIRPSRKKKGAVMGALAGACVGIALLIATRSGEDLEGCGGGCAAGALALGATLGGVPGAAIGGALAPGEKWVEVPRQAVR